jgi:endogenous inhibitor of DNA gyrase (YacG/DUF329 family)
MPNVNCRVCGNTFYVKPYFIKIGWGKYCSSTCRVKSQFNGKEFKCDRCGKSVYRAAAQIKHSQSGKYFCSKKCQTIWRNKYFSGKKHANWLDGNCAYRNVLKGSLRPKCALCNTTDERVLAVHHKDHNRHNNELSNLIWLCYNCHHLCHSDKILDERIKNTFN